MAENDDNLAGALPRLVKLLYQQLVRDQFLVFLSLPKCFEDVFFEFFQLLKVFQCILTEFDHVRVEFRLHLLQDYGDYLLSEGFLRDAEVDEVTKKTKFGAVVSGV